ncbi:hypothetical protein, partial, partial [Parasitella parasitica]
ILVFGITQGRGIHGVEVDGCQVVLGQLGGDRLKVVFVEEKATDMAVLEVDSRGTKVCLQLADGGSASISNVNELVFVVGRDCCELTSGGEAGVVHLKV